MSHYCTKSDRTLWYDLLVRFCHYKFPKFPFPLGPSSVILLHKKWSQSMVFNYLWDFVIIHSIISFPIKTIKCHSPEQKVIDLYGMTCLWDFVIINFSIYIPIRTIKCHPSVPKSDRTLWYVKFVLPQRALRTLWG